MGGLLSLFGGEMRRRGRVISFSWDYSGVGRAEGRFFLEAEA